MDVLRLSDDHHQWLRALTSDIFRKSEDDFGFFVQDVAESLVTPKHDLRITRKADKNSDDKLAVHQAVAALSSIFVEAAKRNSSADAIGLYLQAIGVPDRQIKEITSVYSARRADFRKVLSAVGFTFPVVTDVDWRLDWTIKSNQVPRICEPVYRIQLETLSRTAELQPITFSMSVEELQELVWSLKNAVKSVERHTQP